MATTDPNMVWVFCGQGAQFPAAVFTSLAKAEAWIVRNAATGVVTAYPLDESTYDWAVAKGFFKPKKPEHATPRFVARFSSATQPHYHYEEGKRT